ncbi:MAG TPA: carboxymuconolactone decarboxylase family protein [Gemmatimonadaceae bacterium]|nr:carboxymuconolactone decarboxylase family protein [Gemmatimonadaceae bacterium]
MTPPMPADDSMQQLDDETRALVRLSAVITAGSEIEIRAAMAYAAARVRAVWIEELLLQTYLFAGFPRALNATREWRRLQPSPIDSDGRRGADWRSDGAAACERVYGDMYVRLRSNIRSLHPLLDEWMIVEGYGKVLSRRALDLPRRELCIVAACAAAGQDRQLHSHLHGALNVGVAPGTVDSAIDAISDLIGAERTGAVRMLWTRVKGK